MTSMTDFPSSVLEVINGLFQTCACNNLEQAVQKNFRTQHYYNLFADFVVTIKFNVRNHAWNDKKVEWVAPATRFVSGWL